MSRILLVDGDKEFCELLQLEGFEVDAEGGIYARNLKPSGLSVVIELPEADA